MRLPAVPSTSGGDVFESNALCGPLQSCGRRMDFSQEDMAYFRVKAVNDIMELNVD